MQLYDMQGQSCGAFDGDTAPDGYWLRPDDAPASLPRLEFLDRVGGTRFAAIWQAMLANPAIAFQVMRGFAAETVQCRESFPALVAMEQAGVIPAGSAIDVWS